MKHLTTLILALLVTISVTSNAQEKKPKPEPPKIEIQLEPLGGTPAPNPNRVPLGPNGAVFPKIIAGAYIIGIIIIPQQPQPVPIELLPLQLQAFAQKDGKGEVTLEATTKDGQKDADRGKNKAKIEVTARSTPPSDNRNGGKIDVADLRIGPDSKEGEAPNEFRLRIDVKYPKPKKEDK